MRTISYFRVSTQKQGQSGLGLEAQRAAVEQFYAMRDCEELGSYVEVESGKHNDRPQLLSALHHAKVTGATLVIAKLDRLSRNAAFLLTLRDAGVQFVCADIPDANTMTIGIMAVMAQAEREAISKRTKEALQAAKARGQKLGNPNGAAALRRAQRGNVNAIARVKDKAQAFALDIQPIIAAIQAEGVSTLSGIAAQLNERGIRTARGGRWEKATVRNILLRR